MLDATQAELETINLDYYLTLIPITILFYDYILTLPAESERFWSRRRCSWATLLFYLNRYLSLFGHAPVIVQHFWRTSIAVEEKIKICDHIQSYHQYLAVAVQLIVAFMQIMRMYALFERRKKVLAFLLVLAIAAVAVGCWAILGKRTHDELEIWIPVGCAAGLSSSNARRLSIAWGGVLVFDLVVFGMTIYKSCSVPRIAQESLLDLVVRDGALYFGVIAAANLANILTFVFGGLFTRGVPTTLTNIISSVMMSRLILNLRDPSLYSNTRHIRTQSDPQFSNIYRPRKILEELEWNPSSTSTGSRSLDFA